jgi:hypothetical protein
MKVILFAIILIVNCPLFFSQNNAGNENDAQRIVITPFVPSDVGGLSANAQNTLKNKLDRIVSKNGISGSSFDQRFVMTAKIVKLSSIVVPSTPPVYSYEIEATLIIGDVVEGTIFSSLGLIITGSGNTEASAEISAIKKIKESDPQYQQFISTGKERIIDYFNKKCDFYLKEAESYTTQDNYEAAIAVLTSVPTVCEECYTKSMIAVGPIYQLQIDKQCKSDLFKAQTAWSAQQNSAGATEAYESLNRIDPNATCFKEALQLNIEISTRIKELEKREWNYQLKVQQDEVDFQKLKIKAARDIGVAYGQNQPKNITYNYRSWWY